jgi:hypothetical protein
MKLLLIVVNSDHAADVGALLEHHGVPGYSEIPTILGKGATGRKLGTRAFPGTSTLFFAAVAPEHCDALVRELRALRDARGPEEGLKVYSLDTKELL